VKYLNRKNNKILVYVVKDSGSAVVMSGVHHLFLLGKTEE